MNQRNLFLSLAGIVILCTPVLATTPRLIKPAILSSTPRTLVLLGTGILVMGWGFVRRRRYH